MPEIELTTAQPFDDGSVPMIKKTALYLIERCNGRDILACELKIENLKILDHPFLVVHRLENHNDPSLGQPAEHDLRDGFVVFF